MFAFEGVCTSLLGTHVRGREVRGGVPVAGTWVAVHLLDAGAPQVDVRASGLPGRPALAPIPG